MKTTKIDTGFGIEIEINHENETVFVSNKLSGDMSKYHGLVKKVKGGINNGNNTN